MNNINFHSLKIIPVPEELRKTVVAIPENKGKSEKKVIHLNRFIRFAVAAASLVIIVAVSIVLFRNAGNTNPIVVQPLSKDSTEALTEFSTEATQITQTEYNSTIQPSSINNRSSDTTSPTETRSTDPTDTYFVHPSQHGTDVYLQPSVVPTNGTESGETTPTNKPISKPTELATAVPAEPPTEKQSSWSPHPPTEAPEFPPYDEPWKAPTGVSTQLLRSLHPADGKVYCRIESFEGELFGNYGLFDKERLMTNLGSNGEYYIYYYRFADYYNVSFESESDTFNCIIYDSNGNVLTTTKIHWS